MQECIYEKRDGDLKVVSETTSSKAYIIMNKLNKLNRQKHHLFDVLSENEIRKLIDDGITHVSIVNNQNKNFETIIPMTKIVYFGGEGKEKGKDISKEKNKESSYFVWFIYAFLIGLSLYVSYYGVEEYKRPERRDIDSSSEVSPIIVVGLILVILFILFSQEGETSRKRSKDAYTTKKV